MLRTLELADVGPAPRLELHLGQRLNVLAGDNGLGKSFVLEVIWWALSGIWSELPAWPRPGEHTKPEIAVEFEDSPGRPDRTTSSFDFSRQRWEPRSFAFAGEPLPSLILYARADGSFAVWDPSRNHHSLRAGGYWGVSDTETAQDPATLRRPPAYLFSAEQLWNGLEMQGKTICNGLIRDWTSWQQQAPGSAGAIAFERLCHTLETISPHPDKGELIRPGPPMRVFADDARDFPTVNAGYGNVPVIHASAGMKRILGLAYLIVWSWREHIEASRLLRRPPVQHFVFLMDEVETHLHPQWQRRIVPALLKVLEGLGPSMQVQAHLTTHAPLVLASLEPIFDQQKDRFFVFALEDQAVKLNEVSWTKQGDAVDWLVSEAFDLQQARSVEAERAIEDAETFMRGDEPRELKTRGAIDAELHRVLAGDDAFWPRWLGFSAEEPPA